VQYYKLTGEILSEINVPMHLLAEESPCDWSCLNAKGHINLYYDSIVCGLLQASSLSIPKRKDNYYTYWWDEELTLLKEKAIQSFNMCALVGKSRNGTVFDNRGVIKLTINVQSGIKKKVVPMSYLIALTMPY